MQWMAEILFSFDACLSLSLCVCVSVHSGPVNQTSLKRLKLRNSNLTCMFPGTVQTWPPKNFSKGDVKIHLVEICTHECLLVLFSNSNFVKDMTRATSKEWKSCSYVSVSGQRVTGEFFCFFTDQNDPLSLKPNPDNFVDNVRASRLLSRLLFSFKPSCCNTEFGNWIVSVFCSSCFWFLTLLIGHWALGSL